MCKQSLNLSIPGEQLRWRAKYRGDGKAYEQAGRMEMKACDRLTRIYGS